MAVDVDRLVVTDSLLSTQALLPREMAFRIGCVGCTSEVAGCFVATAARSQRETLTDELKVASELSGIPVTTTGPQPFTTEGLAVTAMCGSLERPCQDQRLAEVFELPTQKVS